MCKGSAITSRNWHQRLTAVSFAIYSQSFSAFAELQVWLSAVAASLGRDSPGVLDDRLRGSHMTMKALISSAADSERRPRQEWVSYTLGALKLFSWILVALLLAGVTGLLRKT